MLKFVFLMISAGASALFFIFRAIWLEKARKVIMEFDGFSKFARRGWGLDLLIDKNHPDFASTLADKLQSLAYWRRLSNVFITISLTSLVIALWA
jgi:hypothetical protein